MSVKTRTGEKVKVSGQYRPVGKRTEVTFVKGHKVPPFKNSTSFVLVDKTKHSK